MNTPSKTVQSVQQLLADREQVGLAKYGTTVDRADLQAGDWVQHAIEEAADLLLYLVRLRETMPEAVGEISITPPTARLGPFTRTKTPALNPYRRAKAGAAGAVGICQPIRA